ncbi:MAG TPA: methionine--tRNA ligase [Spirochaetia bacterium]|nr:methionine--tRNA ligase [Spirochaetia bacterium]
MASEQQPVDRPVFPTRAIITGGMPYGNKELHFGHIGGVFVQADIFARFLRDRIGNDNVIFQSGTDCYGSPIVEQYERMKEAGEFNGTIQEFVAHNHEKQKKTFAAYQISMNLFAASSFGQPADIHREVSAEILRALHENGHLIKLSVPQFFDTKAGVFLNGRQVIGDCPIEGCRSERGYADECSLGHQYTPGELQNPTSTLTGEVPEMREAENWYIDLAAFREALMAWVHDLENDPGHRPFVAAALREFFEKPTIHVTKNQLETLDRVAASLPPHERGEGKSNSVRLIFETLALREEACRILTERGLRYRNGKTLVPFRLTGNIEWGVPAPELDGLSGLTFWVWPESLWAPISFTRAYLASRGASPEAWKDWWCSPETAVYQFIGEDNVYFYGLAEPALFMGLQGHKYSPRPAPGQLQMPILVANNHILFMDKKASSSGAVKPPMADELLEYYTSDQLRAHFASLGLGLRSVSFKPKPLNPEAGPRDGDPVLKEGNLLSNVLNRAVRSCFYTVQGKFGSVIPDGAISEDVIQECRETILQYERAMFRREFHEVMKILDNFIRGINKRWSKNIREATERNDAALEKQTLIDAFHLVKTAVVLMHPIAPEGTERVREYLNLSERLWDWETIFEPLPTLMDDPRAHTLKELPPRTDFFEKHPSQYSGEG